ncbi:hypothetical protein [Nostoc sp.]|uniref:hypothetical protein n=1 Tax=Nostoc sp. TaxID=1180 RepID=UPI002FF4801A
MHFAIKAFSETIVALRSRQRNSHQVRYGNRCVDAVGYATLKISLFVTVPFHRYLQNFS